VRCKRLKINKEGHLIFNNFRVKKFTVRNTKKKNFDVWMLWSPRFHGMRSCNFLKLISNKITSKSYGYFLKFIDFNFLRNWFFQLCQKLQSLVKKIQGILGVKVILLDINLKKYSPSFHGIKKIITIKNQSFFFSFSFWIIFIVKFFTPNSWKLNAIWKSL
jgi:hypothetical protein